MVLKKISASGAKCYACSYKANAGFLYPLERGFIFVNKPALHILFSDISCVKFDRSNQGTRSFDFEIEHTNGTKYLFSGIEKTEQEKLAEFIKQKGMRIAKSAKEAQTKIQLDGEDSDLDPYAERMKAEGRVRDDDDEDSEGDEDFEAASESEDDIEYDSDASIDSASSGDESGSGSDSGSDGSGSDDDKKKKSKRSKSDKKASSKSSKDTKSKSKDKSPAKRKSSDSKEKSKKAKSESSSSKTESGKTPKSAEFVEDSDSSD